MDRDLKAAYSYVADENCMRCDLSPEICSIAFFLKKRNRTASKIKLQIICEGVVVEKETNHTYCTPKIEALSFDENDSVLGGYSSQQLVIDHQKDLR